MYSKFKTVWTAYCETLPCHRIKNRKRRVWSSVVVLEYARPHIQFQGHHHQDKERYSQQGQGRCLLPCWVTCVISGAEAARSVLSGLSEGDFFFILIIFLFYKSDKRLNICGLEKHPLLFQRTQTRVVSGAHMAIHSHCSSSFKGSSVGTCTQVAHTKTKSFFKVVFLKTMQLYISAKFTVVHIFRLGKLQFSFLQYRK